ncbi:EPT/RTPC-like protein [Lentithecium fluviatile CBS 122367]|uniref:EPT/RTPC-like protein n=1 Tax=Lentithecium fluviatile CBS 122367 TaxID=1168545 RepID=A0A6G1INN9_9PLEO|nr:EPT/RTPC-like protein [Lentithecium fluviatile CBS 122367]
MSSQVPVTLFGTQYEGGGGLIRDSLSFAALLNKRLTITSIRANRPGKGGLRIEHTVAICTMAYLTGALVEGNKTASHQITFKPHENQAAEQIRKHLDITIEGSAAIFTIALLPYLLFSHLGVAAHVQPTIPENGMEITIRAGTLCIKAPSFHYLKHVFMPTLKTLGIGEYNIRLSPEYDQGFHTDFVKLPGRIKIWVKPLTYPLKPFVLKNRGRLARIRIIAHAPEGEFEQFGAVVKREVEDSLGGSGSLRGHDVEIEVTSIPTVLPDQYHLLLVGETIGPEAFLGYEQVYPQTSGFPDKLGDNKKELYTHLSRVCIRGLIGELKSGNAIDENLEDMMAVYQSLADGFSSVTAPGNEKLVRVDSGIQVPLSMIFLNSLDPPQC